MALVVKNHLQCRRLRDASATLGREDPLEKGMATHSSIFAKRTMERGTWWATVHRIAKRGTD